MSVVAGFVADSEGRADLQGMVASGAHVQGKGQPGGPTAIAALSGKGGTDPALSAWRAQFAALVSGTGSSSATVGTESLSATEAAANGAEAESAASPSALLSSAGSILRSGLAVVDGTNSEASAAAAANSLPTKAELAVQLPALTGRRGLANGKTKIPNSSQPFNSTTARQPVQSKHTKRETASSGAASDLAQVSPGTLSLLQISPEAAAWAMSASAAAMSQTALPAPIVPSPTGSASTSLHAKAVASLGAGTVASVVGNPLNLQAKAGRASSSPSSSAPQSGNSAGTPLPGSVSGTASALEAHLPVALHADAGLETTPPALASMPPVSGEAKTPGGSSGDAGTINSIETVSPAAGVRDSSHSVAPVQLNGVASAPLQGQIHPPAQSESQPAASVQPTAAGNQAIPATGPGAAVPLQSPTAPPGPNSSPALAPASASGQVSARTSIRTSDFDHPEHATHPAQVHAGMTTSDTSSLVRDPGVTRSATGSSSPIPAGGTGPATGSGGASTFAALDSASGRADQSWIHAGSQHAEAGFQDPALGWVGVRADVNAGVVHATVIPGSADAAQALDGHMAGLNAYLSGEHQHVETLTLAAPPSSNGGFTMGQGSGQGMNQNPGQGTNQGGGQGSAPNGYSGSSNPQTIAPVSSSATALDAHLPSFNSPLGTTAGGPMRQGRHISVVA